MKNLSFRQLRIFESAARLSSFVSAPAISMQMKDLEEDLGMPLFAKRGRGLVLTSAGEYFLVYARRVLIALKETEDMMLKLKGMEIGTLNIGLVSTAKYIAPHLLARFRLEHPGIKLVIHVRNRDQLIGLLREAAIDVAIMGKPPKDLDVRAEAFANNPHAFICSPDHPLAQERTVNLAQLDSEEILIREQGSGTRTVMENFFEVGRFRPLSTLEMSTTETIKQAVMAGLGISFVSLHAVGLETKHGVLRILAVEGTPVIRVWHLVSRGGRPASLAAEAFRYFVLEQGNALLQDLFGAESERQSTHF
jgi:LysR family transcriptional regulator, low CO2-responsive transcriptional regulator